MKHFLFLLFGIALFTQPLMAQDSIIQNTRTVITANGTQTVSTEQQNKELTDRLKKMKQDKQDERDQKREEKYTYKLIGKIVFAALIAGALVLWRIRKKGSN